MRSNVLLAVFAAALLCSCATEPRLPTIPSGQNVVIVVAMSPGADGKFDIRNEALGTGVSAGAGSGIVAGSLWGLACGPLAILCVPLGAATGAITGSAAGAVVGVTGALSDEKAEKLRERMRRVSNSHPMVADIERNIADRVGKYWKVSSDSLENRLIVQVHELELMSTRAEQIRCAVRVTVTVRPSGESAATVPSGKQYKFLSGYSALATWLDETDDFVDTILASASQQIAAQIVSDLVVR